MIKKIRHFLWQIWIIKDCPLCGKDLKEVGHPKDAGWQYYECTNQSCNFGKDEKLKPISNKG
jgi:hypothetical protein